MINTFHPSGVGGGAGGKSPIPALWVKKNKIAPFHTLHVPFFLVITKTSYIKNCKYDIFLKIGSLFAKKIQFKYYIEYWKCWYRSEWRVCLEKIAV